MPERDDLTERDFETLPLAELHDLTGLEPPDDPDAEAERRYRKQAWDSYRTDLANRDEWGTAREGPVPPADGATKDP